MRETPTQADASASAHRSEKGTMNCSYRVDASSLLKASSKLDRSSEDYRLTSCQFLV